MECVKSKKPSLGYPLQILSQGYLQTSSKGQTGDNKQRQGWRGLGPGEIWQEEEMEEGPSRWIPLVFLGCGQKVR